MYCGKPLIDGKCICHFWNIQNTINFDNDNDVSSSESLNEEDDLSLFIDALNNMKSDFNYQCPNCLGKFNIPYCIKNEESSHNHYHCPFCGLYMTGLSNVG